MDLDATPDRLDPHQPPHVPKTCDQNPPVNDPPPSTHRTGQRALEKTLLRMTQEGLFGQEWISEYIGQLRRKYRSRNTIESYLTILFSFISFLKNSGKETLEMVTRADISAFIEGEQDRGMKPYTVSCRIRGIYSFLYFLQERDVVSPDVTKRKFFIKVPETLPRAIEPEDVRQLLSAVSQPVDQALILVLLRTGMRIGELLNTRLVDLNLKEKRIEIFETPKNRVGRVVYISTDALIALRNWLAVRKRPSEYVICSSWGEPLCYEAVRARFKKCLRAAGLSHKGYTLHCLRHTFASELLNAGMRLECLQQLLGHRDLEMTRRYARLTDNTRKEEYFRAMGIIEKGAIRGHYRCDHTVPQVPQEA
jgi:integrase/recombinase XerD